MEFARIMLEILRTRFDAAVRRENDDAGFEK
jgi:hypothetical protein